MKPPVIQASPTKQVVDSRFILEDGQDGFYARVERLDELRSHSGCALTFWRLANEAILKADSPERVSWSAVEAKTIQEAIGRHGASPEQVSTVLCLHSPAATTKAQQTAILALVERLKPELARRYQDAQNNRALHPMDFNPTH